MRLTILHLSRVAVGVCTVVGLALAQAPSKDLHLRGDRFKPLTYDELTPEQKAMADHLFAGERGGMNGPFECATYAGAPEGRRVGALGLHSGPAEQSIGRRARLSRR